MAAGGMDSADERDQRIGRKEHDAEVARVVEARLQIGEELMVRQRVALVDAHEALHRPVHDDSGGSTTRRCWQMQNAAGTTSHSYQAGRPTCRAQYQIAARPITVISTTCAQPE